MERGNVGAVLKYPFTVTAVRRQVRVEWTWAADHSDPEVQEFRRVVRDPGQYVAEHDGRFPVELIHENGEALFPGNVGLLAESPEIRGFFVFAPRSPGDSRYRLHLLNETLLLHER